MFVLAEFIKENLIAGVKNGSFTRERANILAVDHLAKGFISKEELQTIDEATRPVVEAIEEEIEEDIQQ